MEKELEIKVITENRFCINCHHVATSYSGDPSSYRCFAEENLDSKTLNLVTGYYDKVYKYSTCYLARNNANGCGIEGKWWKQKPIDPPLRALDDRTVNRETKKKTGSISADDL